MEKLTKAELKQLGGLLLAWVQQHVLGDPPSGDVSAAMDATMGEILQGYLLDHAKDLVQGDGDRVSQLVYSFLLSGYWARVKEERGRDPVAPG
jgi:hypothetical protein